MSEMISRTRRRQLIAVAGALSLLAAACGGGATDAAPVVSRGERVSSQLTDGLEAGDSSGQDASSQDNGGNDAGGQNASGEANGEAEATGPAANLFPDIDVVRVSDSTTLNLATELGGGTVPVLLWFWAPH